MENLKNVNLTKQKFDVKSLVPYLGLVFVIIFFGLATKGRVFSGKSLQSMLNDGIYILIGAVGFMFILAQGELDFSFGGIMAVACAAACIAGKINIWLALPAGILTGAAIGLANALIIVKLHVDSFITTLAMQYVCGGAVLVILGNGTQSAPLAILDWYTTPLKIVLIIVFAVTGFFVFEHTYYGKAVKALGASKEAVRQSGINITFMRMLPFIILGGIMGVLGFVSLMRTGSASSATGSTVMMNVLNAVLVGGLPFTGGTTSKFRSVVIGVLIMTILSCGMTLMGIYTTTQQVVKGVVFLGAISLSFDRRNVRVIK